MPNNERARRAVLCAMLLVSTPYGCGCSGSPKQEPPPVAAASAGGTVAVEPGSFGDDLMFMQQHTDIVLLRDASGKSLVAVAPEYQGRVMTSSARGEGGASFGWINREVIAAGKRQPHMTVLGGEDRFWLGPEGGQYALYFAPGAPFEFEHWQVPEAIDWGAWPIRARSATEVTFERDMTLVNHAGTSLSLRAARSVRLLDAAAIARHLGAAPPEGVSVVGYESENTLTNTGSAAWTREGGLVSVWILSMYRPSPRTTIVIPFRAGPEAELGPIVNDAYFGEVPSERLNVSEGVLFFRGDGQQRGKIGLPRPRATPIAGSWDAGQQVLTLVQYTLPDDARDYVNSMWEHQAQPYAGDVINSYNDGAPAPGQPPLGPFYELETSSPAAALAPGESLTHVHRTFHLQAAPAMLDSIAQQHLGASLSQIEAALPH